MFDNFWGRFENCHFFVITVLDKLGHFLFQHLVTLFYGLFFPPRDHWTLLNLATGENNNLHLPVGETTRKYSERVVIRETWNLVFIRLAYKSWLVLVHF